MEPPPAVTQPSNFYSYQIPSHNPPLNCPQSYKQLPTKAEAFENSVSGFQLNIPSLKCPPPLDQPPAVTQPSNFHYYKIPSQFSEPFHQNPLGSQSLNQCPPHDSPRNLKPKWNIRKAHACQRCRIWKQKCNGEWPCGQCLKDWGSCGYDKSKPV